MKAKKLLLCRKVYELSISGIDGERESAKERLEVLMKTYGITLEEIIGEEKQKQVLHFKKGSRDGYKLLLFQLIGYVINNDKILPHIRSKSLHLKGYGDVVIDLTDEQYAKIVRLYKHFEPLLTKEYREHKKREKVIINAFINTNDLFPEKNTSNPRVALTQEEKEEMLRVMELSKSMKANPYVQTLHGKLIDSR